MALKDITTIEETEQLSADATFYTEDGGAFRRSGVDAVKDALGLALESTATKQALLNCFQHVAWIDEHGQEYYGALYDALYNIPLYITATFEPGSNVIYNTDPLSVLRQYLLVTATYENETTQTVTAYTLSGNLTVGTSTITVAYKGRTTTFDVEVSESVLVSISAEFAQNGNVFSSSDELDDLKPFLSVTATYSNGSTASVPIYALSGNLDSATSTITVTYSGKTTTFNVAVSMLPTGYTAKNYVLADGTQCITTTIPETAAKTWWFRHKETRDSYANRLGHIFSSRNFFLPYPFATGAADDVRRVNADRYGLEWMNAGNTYWEWTINTEYTFESYKGGNDVYVNGELKGTMPFGVTEDASQMFAILAWGGDPTATRFYHSGKLFFLKAFNQDGTKVHDFVPCVNSSNVAGLYDLVDSTFYPPTAGTLATD